MKIQSLIQLHDLLPENERIILDVLREIVKDALPDYCKEKFSHNVPYFYGNKGICIIWPASIPRGGFKEGVLIGFQQGSQLKDPVHYLDRGTNKKVYYKIYKSINDIDLNALHKILEEAILLDQSFKTKK